MKLRFQKLLPLVALPAFILCSCNLDGDFVSYDDWREENDRYTEAVDVSEFPPYAPDWAPLNTVYIKWHNDRSKTAANIVPISTSTVNVKYELEDINGKILGNSYSASTGDSIYRTTPNSNIIGFWETVTAMHVGDSVTVIIPYQSAYGDQTRGNIKPYSNLIYRIKLKSVEDYDRPHN